MSVQQSELRAAVGITEFAASRLVTFDAPGDRVTLARVAAGALRVAVPAGCGVLARLDDAIAVDVSIGVDPGADGAPEGLTRARGPGSLVLASPGLELIPLRLHEDTCFLRAASVWALDGGLLWERGAVPEARGTPRLVGGAGERALEVLRLKGAGVVAVGLPGPCVGLQVRDGAPIRVRERGFVGWIGGVVPTREPGSAASRSVLCEGEGTALVCAPDRGAQSRW